MQEFHDFRIILTDYIRLPFENQATRDFLLTEISIHCVIQVYPSVAARNIYTNTFCNRSRAPLFLKIGWGYGNKG